MGRHSKPKEPKLSFLTTAGGIFVGVLAIGVLYVGSVITGVLPNPIEPDQAVKPPISSTESTTSNMVNSSTTGTANIPVSVPPATAVPTPGPIIPSPVRPPQAPETPVPPVVAVPPADININAEIPGLAGTEVEVETQKGLDIDLGVDVPLLNTIAEQVKQLPLLGK